MPDVAKTAANFPERERARERKYEQLFWSSEVYFLLKRERGGGEKKKATLGANELSPRSFSLLCRWSCE